MCLNVLKQVAALTNQLILMKVPYCLKRTCHTKALPWLDYKKMVFNSYNIDMKANTVNPSSDQAEIINRVCKMESVKIVQFRE